MEIYRSFHIVIQRWNIWLVSKFVKLSREGFQAQLRGSQPRQPLNSAKYSKSIKGLQASHGIASSQNHVVQIQLTYSESVVLSELARAKLYHIPVPVISASRYYLTLSLSFAQDAEPYPRLSKKSGPHGDCPEAPRRREWSSNPTIKDSSLRIQTCKN